MEIFIRKPRFTIIISRKRHYDSIKHPLYNYIKGCGLQLWLFKHFIWIGH